MAEKIATRNAPNDQQLEQAVSELKAKIKELEGN